MIQLKSPAVQTDQTPNKSKIAAPVSRVKRESDDFSPKKTVKPVLPKKRSASDDTNNTPKKKFAFSCPSCAKLYKLEGYYLKHIEHCQESEEDDDVDDESDEDECYLIDNNIGNVL